MIPKIIGFNRQVGKTRELIKLSAKEHLYIVCADKQRLENITRMARKMELDIPHPITVDELPLRSRFIKQVIVDDVEYVLSRFIGKEVLAMSTSFPCESLTVVPILREDE
jgi:hypothetical protein